jgi:uncharacterized protein YecE (DUF72 family)
VETRRSSRGAHEDGWRRRAMNLYVGTSGYQYKEWRGPFYPEGLKEKDMLRHYATRLPAVEINNTFYRTPAPSVFEGWSAAVTDDFRFSIKASRRITHLSRLAGAEETTRTLFEGCASLGSKLGIVLFQLPPYFKKDLPRLEAFLATLPSGVACAFEFRHDSWRGDDVHRVLSEAGRALCYADTEEVDEAEPTLRTANVGYLRLRRQDYTDADLERWAGRVRAEGWESVFVFFKHEDAGAGPRLAARFLELIG